MSAPRVSVLIDTYNYGQYIDAAIESVLAQDFPAEETEILVIDDGSTDDTRARVGKYAGRVKYIWKENGGQASAFNCGLAEARGELIFLLDADDYWRPGKLRKIADSFAQNPDAGMIYHRYEELDETSGKISLLEAPLISGFLPERKVDLISYWIYPTSTLAFRRESIKALLPVPEGLKIQADGYLAALVVFLGPVMGVAEPLAIYRVHGKNLFRGSGGTRENERIQRRITTRQVFLAEVTAWLARSGRDVTREPIRSFLAQWELAQEAERFRLAAPGRLKTFRHLLKYPHYFGERMSWRHQAAAYLDALGGLVLGYGRYGAVERWRRDAKRVLGTTAGSE
ncbi:MAG: glycosyl transferase [Candidatus Acidoferrum typicum]|nr:glycosyl transferase [Candidatus Acidoferrum typicum]